MFSLEKARRTLERWLLTGEDAFNASPARETVGHHPAEAQATDSRSPVHRFMDEVMATSQEWLGRVRLIKLEDIRARLGDRWPKLKDKVEILTAKVIEGALSPRDRYIHTGDGEFLIFFADATPDESSIRALAIVELIRIKLFGAGAPGMGPVAGCELVHRNSLPHDGSANSDGAVGRTQHARPQLLDGTGLQASSRNAIGSILTTALESQAPDEIAQLLLRLKQLSRSLKTLEPVLEAMETGPIDLPRHINLAADQSLAANHARHFSFGDDWDDIVEMISALDISEQQNSEHRRSTLEALRRKRAARPVDFGLDASFCKVPRGMSDEFEYLPVLRSIDRGGQIVQGMYRVEPPIPEWRLYLANSSNNLLTSPDVRHAMMRAERAALAHAIDCLLKHEPARFMLMVPVHVDTLRGPHSQTRYSTILRSAEGRVSGRLLIRVVGYRESDDTIGIRRAINELRMHSHAVFVTAPPEGGDIGRIAAQCKSLGVRALGIDVGKYAENTPAALAAIGRLANAADRQRISFFVDGIDKVAVLANAIAQGAQYMCAPSLRPPLALPDEMKIVSLDDLYAPLAC